MTEIIQKIPARLKNAAVGGHVAGVEDIVDDATGKTQQEINTEVAEDVSDIKGGSTESIADLRNAIDGAGGLNERLHTVEELGSISVGGGDIGIATAADFTTRTTAGDAKVPTVLAVVNGIGDGVWDISAHNNNTTYADLAAALGADGVNVPEGVRKGGMSVKFVQSSDNKYIRYNLLADEFTTDTAQWAICDDGVYIENPEFVYVKTDAESKILIAIEKNGNVNFGAGVPQQVIDYIQQKIDEYKCGDIVDFVGELINGDKTLQQLLNEKVDKEEGKSLIDEDFASAQSAENNSEFLEVKTDSDNKIVEGIKKDGTKVEYTDVEYPNGIPTQIEEEINSANRTDNKVKVLSLLWENGIYTNRTPTASSNGVRVPEIKGSGLYLLTFGDNYYAVIKNAKYSYTVYHPTSIFVEDDDDYLCIYLRLKNGNNLTTSNFNNNDVKLYYLNSNIKKAEFDIVVSASDSFDNDKNGSNVIVDGTNDTRILASLFGSTYTIKVLLLPGIYNINEFWTTQQGAAKCSLSLIKDAPGRRIINIQGISSIGWHESSRNATLLVSKSLHDSINVESQCNYFIIALPYEYGMGQPYEAKRLGQEKIIVNFSKFEIQGYKYDKPITYIDTTVCSATMIEHVFVNSWAENAHRLAAFNDTPHSGCTGIRVGKGSNDGIENYIKHTFVIYCYKGIAVNGEHFVFEDVLTHHCYIGWYFGDRYTTGALEHPNMMIGCSIEGCYRFMVLSGRGIESSEQYYELWPSVSFGSTLVCIGLSTENQWAIPINERIEGEPTQVTTLPIKEIVRPRTDTNPLSYSSPWSGRIEGDYITKEEDMSITFVSQVTQEPVTIVANSCNRFRFLNYKSL